jgi:hypothetical protein
MRGDFGETGVAALVVGTHDLELWSGCSLDERSEIQGRTRDRKIPHFAPLMRATRCAASRATYLRFARQRKDGKEHRYWSIVESRFRAGGRVVKQRTGISAEQVTEIYSHL